MPPSIMDQLGPSPTTFGHELLKYFLFKPGFNNLNHGDFPLCMKCHNVLLIHKMVYSKGSWGSLPRCVAQVHNELFEESESCPELFMKNGYLPRLTRVRERISKIMGASMEEVVMIPNTSTGVNVVMRNLEWHDDDIIVGGQLTLYSRC